MRKSTIPFLLINLFALLFLSCGSSPVKDLASVPVKDAQFRSAYFSDPTIDYVYRTNISVYGNELSGICIIKKIGDIHRVVFTTEFGNKLLDFEISATDYKVNAIVEELDRKMLIRILVNDFRMLLRETYAIDAQFEAAQNYILQSKFENHFNYLYVSKSDRKLSQLRHTSKRKEKINIGYLSENNIFADKIVIRHYDLKLRIEFNYLKNQ